MDDMIENVWSYMSELDALCIKQFPYDSALAVEAQGYVLRKLSNNDWERVRAWNGSTSFRAFLWFLVKRLLVDFRREKYGHNRAPLWLQKSNSPIIEKAYELIVRKKYDRREAAATLTVLFPKATLGEVKEAVSAALAVRSSPKRRMKCIEPEVVEEAAEQPAVWARNAVERRVVAETILQVATTTRENGAPGINTELLQRLNGSIYLASEERLFLRLRYLENKSIKEVVELLHVEGDPYKQLKRILRKIRKACVDAGIL